MSSGSGTRALSAGRRDDRGSSAASPTSRQNLGLTDLDGVVMANSLHFLRDKARVLARVRGMLRRGSPLLLVEYDSDRGNTWVPHPLSFDTWRSLAVANGFDEPKLLDSQPSRFMGRIYSASATKT